MRKKKSSQVNLGHYHEALDRTYVVFEMLDKIVVQHPIYSKEREFKYLIDKAATALWEAYQIAGTLLHEEGIRSKKKLQNTKRRTKGAA